jgi:hypothetical protein
MMTARALEDVSIRLNMRNPFRIRFEGREGRGDGRGGGRGRSRDLAAVLASGERRSDRKGAVGVSANVERWAGRDVAFGRGADDSLARTREGKRVSLSR